MKYFLSAIVVVGLIFVSMTALAQEVIMGVDEDFWSTSTSSSTTVLTTGVGILTVQRIVDARAVNTYVRQNRVAIQHDLHLGGGQTAKDLAAAFQVEEEEFEAFAEVLFLHREALAELLDEPVLDDASLARFQAIIVDGLAVL